MNLIEWKDEYSVGDASIDHEHQELIALINDIYARLRDPADAASVDDSLGEICSNIAAHFALEEHVMRKAQYPEYEAHKENHELLLDEIHELMDGFADDPQSGRELLQKELSDWFSTHFSTFDARLHRQLGV